MRTFIFAGLILLALTATALAGTIRVDNGDSKTYKVELKCSGSSKTVEIRSSTTASYTFNSTAKECDIVGGDLTFPTKKLVDGQKWRIRQGKVSAY